MRVTEDENDSALRPAEEPEARRAAEAFDEFASWVPPWARSQPQLVVEPAADYTAEEMGIGRFAAHAPPDGVAPQDPGATLDADASTPDADASAPDADAPAPDADEPPDPEEFEPGMADDELRGALEAIMLVVDEPVATVLLAQVLEEPTSRVEATMRTLAEEYVATGRGFELRQAAGGWRLFTRSAFAAYVERFVLDGQQVRLTQAALETLAVVAYRQPATRSRISAIRGVNCDGVIKTLMTRGLVEECGTEPESGAHIYRTTRLFLEKLAINSVADLPSLGPFLPNTIDEIDFAQR